MKLKISEQKTPIIQIGTDEVVPVEVSFKLWLKNAKFYYTNFENEIRVSL